MHDVKEFGEDKSVGGIGQRRYRPWCACGWIGEWTDYGYQQDLGRIRAAANKQFMRHLEVIQPYINMATRVFGKAEG